ncbi:mediator of RNA polymerase II transcription subunit 14-like isoform X2 [Planococcus citri]|uniref:mediator of RNA polymerase II transcription subunit 14-like isoform X2 n=1 Tax=Planococcus citri TaxID=170843 RepID=UPI0031F7AC5D
MSPVPVNGNQTPPGSNMVQDGTKAGTISLSLLIDFIIQRTYHELTVLAELLPRKTDTERKVEIFNYANRTRQLFIRLMALIKWLNSASKVEKSNRIMGFLDKQALLFVDTADLLARIARDTVVKARLPYLHIPAAVEVLATGAYTRIPCCVKNRILPSEPITPSERRSVLLKLNQVIQHRLVSSNLLPQMKNLKIENGRVTFHVANEFEVSLTVMGDDPVMPWRLLSIDILVEDRETGEGKPLSHSVQKQYMQQVLQARIAEATDPLKEVYSFLHFFCQSLQLEVFFSQTIKLCRDRLDGHVAVNKYFQGKSLSVSYWKELTAKDSKSELGYTLTLLVDTNRPDRPLNVVHVPSLECAEIDSMEETLNTDHLSMEKLLVHTIYIRSKNRLIELKKEIKSTVKGIRYDLQGTPAILSVAVLWPCLPAEQLLVTVDTHTGMIQCHIPQYGNRYPPVVSELQNAFNTDRSNIPALISDIRYWLAKQRCLKTLQHLPVTVGEHLPLLYESTHPINEISKRRMYVTFHRHSNFILIVEIKEKLKNPCEMEYGFYLIHVKRSTVKENVSNDPCEENEAPKLYLKAFAKIQLDTFVVTHGFSTSVIDAIPNKYASSKRKNLIAIETASKKTKHPAYFIPELAHAVALCDQRIPFTTLTQELTKREISHQGIQVEANATALSVKLIQLPPPPGIDVTNPGWITLTKRLLSVSIRSISKENGHFWAIEFVMYGTPVSTASIHSREQGTRRPVYFQHEMNSSESASKIVDSLMADWSQIVHLYCLIEDMAEYSRLGKFNSSSVATVTSYNYSSLVICYGDARRQATATFRWNANINSFEISFGFTGIGSNAHSLVKEQLEDHLNRNRNLAQLIQILCETYPPLVSLNRLPSTPHLYVTNSEPLAPVITFIVIAQSSTVLRVVYRASCCLELTLLSDGLISVRDATYCPFDRTNVVSEFVPAAGLKAFLSKYEDEKSILRWRLHSEDDNSPSPICVDPVDSLASFLSHHRGGPKSPIQRSSSPCTPASPHTSVASPPSLQSNINLSPGSSLTRVPSPAGLVPTASPGACSSNIPVGHTSTDSFLAQARQSSRILLETPWADAVSTILSHEALDSLCTPSAHPQDLPGPELCPLERFLGCVSLRRHLQRTVQSEEISESIQNPELDIVNFKVNSLQCLVCTNQDHFQSLSIKITATSENKEPWTAEELQVMEKFFDMRVAAPPYKSHSVDMFTKLLTCQHRFLQDFIQLIKLDLMPNLVQQQGMKWMPQICLRVPPTALSFVNAGAVAFVIHESKILFFLHVVKVGSTSDVPFLMLPVLYDTQNNTTQLAEKKDDLATSNLAYARAHIKRFSEYNTQHNECSLFPTIRDFLMNFALPSEPSASTIQSSAGLSPVMANAPAQQMNPSLQ